MSSESSLNGISIGDGSSKSRTHSTISRSMLKTLLSDMEKRDSIPQVMGSLPEPSLEDEETALKSGAKGQDSSGSKDSSSSYGSSANTLKESARAGVLMHRDRVCAWTGRCS